MPSNLCEYNTVPEVITECRGVRRRKTENKDNGVMFSSAQGIISDIRIEDLYKSKVRINKHRLLQSNGWD